MDQDKINLEITKIRYLINLKRMQFRQNELDKKIDYLQNVINQKIKIL